MTTGTTADAASARTTDGGVAVRIEGLRKSFGAVHAVDGIDLEIGDGEFFAMLGPSGSGKTTTLRMIAGFEYPTAGRVLLHGRDVTGLPPFDRDVNTVFQDYALFPHMSVADNVGYGLMVRRVGKGERRERVSEALRAVRLGDHGGRRPHQLSGGQRQRVALARALVNQPRVVLLDEPLGALDLKLREEMRTELKDLQRRTGVTFVFVTHDQDEALAMSDRIAVFNAGRIEQVGTPVEIYEHPATPFVAGFVGTSNLLQGAAAERVLGAPGAFTVRPERLRVTAPDSPVGADECAATGSVRDSAYLGAVTRHTVVLDADGTELVVQAQNTDAATHGALRGQPVQLVWKRAHNLPLVVGATRRERQETAGQ